jgi:hypothetical protein
MKEVRVKGELLSSQYVKSFFQRGVHYVVVNSLHEPFASNRRRVLNIKDLESHDQEWVLRPFSTKSLDDYL